MFYGPKEATWNEYEMLIRVILRRIRNVNAFNGLRTSKVMTCFSNVQRKFHRRF